MAGTRAMLARVRRLEQVRTPTSPFGCIDTFDAECQAGIEEGDLDGRDVPMVLLAIRRWHKDGWFGR